MNEEARILDANTATREELVERGVLPALADRIVRHRAEHGPFRDENELYDVVRDNEIRMDQLLGLVGLPNRENPQGYST